MWEAPGKMQYAATCFDPLYQEIATGLRALAMTFVIGFAYVITTHYLHFGETPWLIYKSKT